MLRISNMLMAHNLRNYIQNNLQRSAKSQEHISTGKTINRPSDNPSQISQLMAVNATLIGNEQYLRNIQDGLGYLNQSDSAINTVGKTLQDTKILALQGANGTLTQEDMNAIANQIDRQVDSLVDLSNSSLGGKYLFAGTKNGQPPFYRDPKTGDVYYRGNTQLISREIIFGYSYEVVAAGAADNTLIGHADLSRGVIFNSDSEKVFGVEINGIKTTIDLTSDPDIAQRLTGGSYTLSQVKDAIQSALNNKIGPGLVDVKDDGKGNLKLTAEPLDALYGTADLSSGGGAFAPEDKIFSIELNGVKKDINLSSYTLTTFQDIKTAIQTECDNQFGSNKIIVGDDGNNHIRLITVGGVSEFKVLASGTNTGHTAIFGGEQRAEHKQETFSIFADGANTGHTILFGGSASAPGGGVFGKLTNPYNPANLIDDPMNNGQKMVKVAGGPFEVLRRLSADLRNGDVDSLNKTLSELDDAHDTILKHRVGVGARTRHLEAVKEQLEDQEIKLKGILVDIQGADIAKLTVEVAQNQLVHQASLMTASNLLNVSLLQYLK